MDETTFRIKESYDQLSREYARRLYHELQNKPLDRQLLDRFARRTAGRGTVCDLGCGPGQIARYLRDCSADVFGADLSPAMVETARRLNPDIVFEEDNITALSLKDESLAGIAAFYAIVNIPECALPLVFQEMKRVLQPGGHLLLAFHVGEGAIQVQELWGHAISMAFYLFKTAATEKLLRAAGLRVEETIERGPYAPDVEHQSRRAYIFVRK